MSLSLNDVVKLGVPLSFRALRVVFHERLNNLFGVLWHHENIEGGRIPVDVLDVVDRKFTCVRISVNRLLTWD